MKKVYILRLFALALALCALFALTSCRRDPGPDAPRMDITIDNSGKPAAPPDYEPEIDISEYVPRPERHLPFQPGEISYENDNLNIKMIEVNQGLSYGFDDETGELYAMENFVAGKETAIFIAFEQPFDRSSEAFLLVERDGQTVAQLQPVGVPDDCTLLFQPRDMAEVNYWEAGAYTFTFEMDGGRAVRTVNFFESTYLKILAVPVLANYSGRIVGCDGEWRNGAAMIIAAYPIARSNVEYILAPELNLSDSRYDLNTDDGMYNVWQALTNLQTRSDPYTLIIGYIRDPAGHGRVLGYTYGMPTTIVVESEPDMLATVPHEIAHCYKIGDEYEGGHLNLELNPAPYGMSGRDIMTNRPVTSQNPLIIGGARAGVRGSGAVIYEEQRPYWVEGSTLLGSVTSYMGWGTGADSFSMWTTSDIWNHIYRVYVGHVAGDEIDGSGGVIRDAEYWGQCPSCYGSVYDPDFYVECRNCLELTKVTGYEFQCSGCQSYWSIDDYYEDLYLECTTCRYFIWYNWFEEHNSDSGAFAHSTTSQQGVFTQITGYIDANGAFTPTPWYTYEANQNVVIPSGLGEYGVYIYDPAGSLLSVTHFNIDAYAKIVTEDGPAFADFDRTPVNVSVRFPDNAARIDIQKGQDVIFTQNVSQNAPTVSFTGLTNYQQLPDFATLTWDSYDEDGDDLWYEIWYYPGEYECYNVAANITGNSVTIDLSELPGTHFGHFHIYATDGVWTAEADSPWIKVSYKAPVILSELDGIPEFKLTEEISFDVDVYDMQDGWLWSNGSVVWTFEGSEYLSTSLLWVWPFELQPGLHTFTCTATNSEGLTTSKDYTFRILDDDSDLPDDWSRGEIIEALSHGFVLPLDRLDAPITRKQFSDMMVVLFLYVLEYDFSYSDYSAFLADCELVDCSEDDLGPYLMVFLGVMDAPDGRFDPARSLTEREAAIIMYKVVALADPDLLDIDYSETQMLRVLDSNDLFDQSGPNIYQESERLTVRLTLVRCYRFFDAIFI